MDGILGLIVGAWFVGGFVSGVSGIGGALVAVPIAALFMPMHEVVVLSCILNVFMDGAIACMHFRHARTRSLLPMLLGALPGSVLGLAILRVIPGAWLQGLVGAFLLFFLWWQCAARVRRGAGEARLWGGAAGFGAGLLGTAISFDGPPIAAYGLYAGWTPRVFLGTLGVFFVLRGLLTCALQAGAGYYTPEIIRYACYGAPAVVLGTLCSFPVVRRIPAEAFRRVLLVIIALAAAVCLARAVA